MLLICLFLLSISCKKEKVSKENYRIGIENRYFERIDSVSIGSKMTKEPIEVSQTYFFKEYFPKNTYEVRCYTASHLVIKTTLKAVDHQENILLSLNADGVLSIKK